MRVRPSTLLLLATVPALLAPKCIDYDAPADSGRPDAGRVDAGTDAGGVDAGPADGGADAGPADAGFDAGPEPLSAAGMRRAACLADRCRAPAAVRYWKDDWELFHVQRTVTLADDELAVTDADGAPAALTFESGIPVTLTVVLPDDATSAHDLTAPGFFRTVAWRDVETGDGGYRAPTFDAVLPRFEPGVSHAAVLRFVPIERGEHVAYSSTGVTDGQRYAEILTGAVAPDLDTGDAAAGLTATVSVTGPAEITVFQGSDPDRAAALDADPRRDADHAVWDPAAVTTIGIDSIEGIDPMTGLSVFTFDWTTRELRQGVGHVLELSSRPGNDFQHNFTAQGLLIDAVLRRVVDSEVELRAPYVETTNVDAGALIQIWLVPTVVKDYQTYCQIGVVHADNGAPDLTTGHAGAGMLDTIRVRP